MATLAASKLDYLTSFYHHRSAVPATTFSLTVEAKLLGENNIGLSHGKAV